jgi:hypothetical protein
MSMLVTDRKVASRHLAIATALLCLLGVAVSVKLTRIHLFARAEEECPRMGSTG